MLIKFIFYFFINFVRIVDFHNHTAKVRQYFLIRKYFRIKI
nr:MAG TPA: hypothetical protein [Caudoviricetes sp.]